MKLKSMAVAVFLAALGASAHAYNYTGDTTGGLTFNRPVSLGSLSGVGTAVPYSDLSFTVDTTGSYTFLTTTGGAYDPFIALYSPSFNPAAGLTNLMALNDDFPTGNFSQSSLTTNLTAGTSYVFVNTGFANSDFGAFSSSITGPGNVTPVPEPASWGLMALGLLGVGAAARRSRQAQTA